MQGDVVVRHAGRVVGEVRRADRREQLLAAALEKQKTNHFWGNVINALASFGTPTARAALITARDKADIRRKADINKTLELLSSRSPGYHFIREAEEFRANKQEKQAIEAYDTAIQIDPVLPEAYFGRAMVFLQLQRHAAARREFEKVLELRHEPQRSRFVEFVTSYALTRVVDGDLVDALKYLEANRAEGIKQSQEPGAKGLFHYNAACSYARAIEQVEKLPELPNRTELGEKYRKQAIDDLTEAFKQGFDDYIWTEKDPDFKVLRDDPDFLKILANKPGDKSQKAPPRGDE